uniref:uncharacterized protein LOC101310719 isoform X1 n=1 Tax=Fragaria vesca subsp. vesca TaxID=101020 RepID=UPI0005C89D7C|nr:PREDICTED: uncharacterized protein LOC101310719 isoform X1 [Fragaria vesca subsp. vesca]XP_011467525.1 PREDICTED: uncharacterized protein LOC101310719 isoform X1 [Fragaria vesca subsp. vesca]
MDFFKVRKFRKAHKPDPENELEDNPVPVPEEPKENGGDGKGKAVNVDPIAEADDDDDDFITEEVKRRLKELRRNSFMVLIPEEESCAEEEEEEEQGETSSNEWRDVEAEGRQWWCGFGAVYDKYCERMLFFERMSTQQVKEIGCLTGIQTPTTPSPRSASKKLSSPFRCLSLKKIEEPNDETEHLQQPEIDPYHDIETSYVGQVCLSWEALHCQYTQLNQLISCQPENPTSYNHSAQQFQQFQVLLQRFIENEPFEEGLRPEIYARTQRILPQLLRVPNIQGPIHKGKDEEEADSMILAPDLIKIIETSILTFLLFLKMDKKKTSAGLSLFGNQNHATPLQQIQTSLDKKSMKLKELRKKRKSWKKSWPQAQEDVQLLFSLVDVKVLSRVLRMGRISKEQLFWCEEKMKKLDLVDGKLWRDPSPTLFPC